jgi:hypothetical protein
MIDAYLARAEAVIATLSAIAVLVSWAAVRWRGLLRGRPERRYERWFVEHHSTYWNPYLDATERVRLDRTYIPLSLDHGVGDWGGPSGAAAAMSNPVAGNMILVGGAGSGKTTTLKAYGVSAIQNGSGHRELPFYVPVRLLAPALRLGGLADFLKAHLLRAGAGLTAEEAQTLLHHLLRQRRCVVLLDGLDEVNSESYRAVRDAVRQFARDHSPELPTADARLVITCRHQNFLRIRDDWVTGPNRIVDDRVYALAPMTDTQISQYLANLRDRFRHPQGPERFIAAVRASGTLHLHRSPLVLAMSLGLYARREFFEIPHSIAELFDLMIKEMLDRHKFRNQDDTSGGVIEFLADDKLRLLREFSLETAHGMTGFGPFTRESLLAYARRIQPRLRHLPIDRVEAFVDEIVDRSGLLSAASDHLYEFAHRSIRDHLVAAELLRSGAEGCASLLACATYREWRQVVIFFTAEADQRVVSPFLTELAATDLALAGECLAGADCLDDHAVPILEQLAAMLWRDERRMLLPALAALLGATTSPRPTTQEAAKKLIYTSLSGVTNEDAVSALGGNVDGLIGVVTMLVDRASPAGLSGVLVSRLTDIVPDDVRIVAPLWRCLADSRADPDGGGRAGTDRATARIVERLLGLAMDVACFEELDRQPSQDVPIFTPELRREVYPFRNGLDLSSNLVTLLCWAERLDVTLAEPNEFLRAKAVDPAAWSQVEADRRRRSREFTVRVPGLPYPHLASRTPASRTAGLGLSILTALVAVAALTGPDAASGGWVAVGALALAVGGAAIAANLVGLGVRLGRERRFQVWSANPYVGMYDDPRSRHWLVRPDQAGGS